MVQDGLGGELASPREAVREQLTTVKVTLAGIDKGPVPVDDAADLAVDVIKKGGLALIPFGVAYAFLTGARAPLDRIYELKLRSPDKACPILVTWDDFADAVGASGPEGDLEVIRRIVDADLPVGVLVEPDWNSAMVRSVPRDCLDLLSSGGKLGLFMNMGGMSRHLLEAGDRAGVRLFGSSANLSGQGNSFSPQDVPQSIVDAMDIVCDAGTCMFANPGRMPSSIVDFGTRRLTRRGILHEEIGRLLDG